MMGLRRRLGRGVLIPLAIRGVKFAYARSSLGDSSPLPTGPGRKSTLRGIVFDVGTMLDFLDVVSRHARDLSGFDIRNGSFGGADAYALWAVLREKKPRRMIEVGAGNSTLLARLAAQANVAEGYPLELITIDPYAPFPEGLVRQPVEDVDPALFEKLDAGDVLFIDSSHILREGGDVWFLYCEVLPRLREGVLVHVHDVSLPWPHPPKTREDGLFWTEQYVLQAVLACNDRFRVIWAGAWIHHTQRARLEQAIPDVGVGPPGSFWIEVTKPGSATGVLS